MSGSELPAPFKSLEPWVEAWSIPHEAGRFNKRVSSGMRELDAFVAAFLPRIVEIIDFLNALPTADPDALKPEERRLFDLALMYMEAAIPSDLGWEENDIEDAWPPHRLTFLDPGIFPEPANRK
jgi:hypothetical protein